MNVSVSNAEMLTVYDFSENFKESFLNGSLYEGLSVEDDSYDTKVRYFFNTESEEEFDEETRPYLAIWIENAE